MFKSLGLLIHKTPWWGLLLGGGIVLVSLLLFATPIQVIRLSEQAGSPEEKRAIQHEINQAFKSGGLSVAEGIVSAMKERAKDPDRRRELERALSEIERARAEFSNAQSEAAQAARDAAQEALDAAEETAQAALDAAREARQTVEESRNEALQNLRSKGLDVGATERSFDDLLRGAKEKEAAAQTALDGIAKSREGLNQPSTPAGSEATLRIKVPSASQDKPSVQVTVTPPKVPAPPAPPAPPMASMPAIPPIPPLPALPPELRNSIRASVAGDMWRAGVGSVLILAFIPLFVMLLIAKFFIDRSHRALAFAEKKEEEALVADMRRQMTEARLQALQAQVEPHFLYNTLANVQALTEVDPLAANQLVGHLIQYLRASLPKMRESTSTVGQEVERVRAYLNILKMRMGERLAFDIHIPDDLLGLPFPPMMLPSLVENAIKHGLEPRREGGRIDVVATRLLRDGQARLVLQVKDTGAGLSGQAAESGGGVGLSNLRERLAALYGGSGRFTLETNEPSGVVATIDIPAELPPRPAANGQGVAQTPVPAVPATGWRRIWGVTRKTHSVWAFVVSRIFMALMLVLLLAFLAGLVSLYTGWLPVRINEFRLDGMEGMALGSVGLLVAFGAAALVVGILVALLYGLGFLFAGLMILIPSVILISLFPVLSPFILVGLVIYAIWRKRRKNRTIRDNNPRY